MGTLPSLLPERILPEMNTILPCACKSVSLVFTCGHIFSRTQSCPYDGSVSIHHRREVKLERGEECAECILTDTNLAIHTHVRDERKLGVVEKDLILGLSGHDNEHTFDDVTLDEYHLSWSRGLEVPACIEDDDFFDGTGFLETTATTNPQHRFSIHIGTPSPSERDGSANPCDKCQPPLPICAQELRSSSPFHLASDDVYPFRALFNGLGDCTEHEEWGASLAADAPTRDIFLDRLGPGLDANSEPSTTPPLPVRDTILYEKYDQEPLDLDFSIPFPDFSDEDPWDTSASSCARLSDGSLRQCTGVDDVYQRDTKVPALYDDDQEDDNHEIEQGLPEHLRLRSHFQFIRSNRSIAHIPTSHSPVYTSTVPEIAKRKSTFLSKISKTLQANMQDLATTLFSRRGIDGRPLPRYKHTTSVLESVSRRLSGISQGEVRTERQTEMVRGKLQKRGRQEEEVLWTSDAQRVAAKRS